MKLITKLADLAKRTTAKVLAVVIIVVAIFAAPILSAHAEDLANPYEETHEQINFEDLNVYVVGGDELVVEADNSAGLIRRWKAKGEKAKLDKYLKNHDNAEEDILDMALESDELCAIAYTDAPQ